MKKVDKEIINRVIEMAWEDRTPFEAIKLQFGLCEKDVIGIMRCNMKPSSFKMWRKRVQNRETKHLKKRIFVGGIFKSTAQKSISLNKISKRR
ncbi:MAG: TIGR03643 family protein [Cyclobacteriaceae bacterium]|nr:TIGR03643 family protein [Cyclobacteriaceae bacterium]